MKESCDNFAEMLVDYADGGLSPEQSTKVADHLSECEDCRALLNGLQKSLELAQVIWEDNLSQTTETIGIPAPGRIRRRSWPRYAAAAILIVSAISITSRIINKPAKDEPTFAEIERKITEAGNAARLLAAADLLGAYSEAETIVKQQYRRIVETYPDTSAASKAKLQVE
ncbi:MAG: zf-HC2 domain-containing protein [Planctomycetes bacterium]|nr:zf-HC2 domain-containing protein [Planctomycetota bacterium]